MKKLFILATSIGFIPQNLSISWKTDSYLWMCELQKWLREKHNSIVEIVYSKQDYTSPIKFESTVDYFTKELEYEITTEPEFRSEKFLKYEDALEIGLFNALKLIK